jgi:hypothetical protein
VRRNRSAASELPPTSRSRAATTAADAAAAAAPPPSYVALCRCRHGGDVNSWWRWSWGVVEGGLKLDASRW